MRMCSNGAATRFLFVALAALMASAASSAVTGQLAQARDTPPLPKIEPARLDAPRQTIDLSSECTDIVAAAGGRYLILWHPSERKLAVFDVSAARIVKEIPVASDKMRFAAGADCLIIALLEQKIFQRWNLTDFEREATAPFPENVRDVHAMALGSASTGPAAIVAIGLPEPHLGFLDTASLEMAEFQARWPHFEAIRPSGALDLRASASGNVLACTGRSGGALIGRRDGHKVTLRLAEVPSLPYAAPSESGSRVYGGRSILSWFGNAWRTPAEGVPWYAVVPAVHGDWYLALPHPSRVKQEERGSIHPPDLGGGGFFNVPDEKAGAADEFAHVLLYHASDHRPVAALPEVDLAPTLDEIKNEGRFVRPSLDDRAWFVPRAKLLVVLARSNQQLILHQVDIEELAGDSKFDFLVLASDPPSAVKSGEKLRYPLHVLSKQGGVEFRLVQGPEGMQVDAADVLSWDVPADAPPMAHDVAVAVTDASGREAFQAFSLTVTASKGELAQNAEVRVSVGATGGPDVQKQPLVAPALIKRPSIKPARLAEEEMTIPFEEIIADVAPGGAGRYLAMLIAARGEVAVFDANQAKMIYTIPVQDAQVHLAAGLEKLVIVLAEKRLALCHDLATGRREQVVRLAGDAPIMKVALGSASRGPLITGHYTRELEHRGAVLYDLATLQMLPGISGANHLFRANFPLRVFRDGTLFGTATRAPRGGAFALHGGDIHELPRTWKPGQSSPKLGDHSLTPAGELFFEQCYHLAPPAILPGHSDYYLTYDHKPLEGIKNFRLHLIGESLPLAELPDVTVRHDPSRIGPGRILPPDRRVHLIPDAKLLVTIPLPADRLVLRRLDVEKLIEQSPVDYLVVKSTPPRHALSLVFFAVRSRMNAYIIQREAIYELLESGAFVETEPRNGMLRYLLDEKTYVKVTSVHASGCDGADELMRQVTKFLDIWSLRVAHSRISKESLRQIALLPGLEVLDLQGAHFDAKAFISIDWRESSISALSLSGVAMQEGIVGVGDFLSVESLDLDLCGLDDASLVEIAGLPNLEALSIGFNYIGGSRIGVLGGLKRLRSLDLERNPLVSEELGGLGRLKGLIQLNIKDTGLRDAGAFVVGELQQLKWLDISGNELTESGITSLGGLRELKELRLGAVQLDGGCFKPIGELPLEEIWLRGAILSGDGFRFLSRLEKIREIYVDGSNISFDELLMLVNAPTLTKLSIQAVSINHSELMKLQQLMPGVSIEH